MLSPELRTLRARIGAFALHASHDPQQTTTRAREAFMSSFEREVDPNGLLPPAERERRAGAAHKAHMAKLALASATKRRALAALPPANPITTIVLTAEYATEPDLARCARALLVLLVPAQDETPARAG